MLSSDVIEIETTVVLLLTLGRISASTQELCNSKKLKILFLTFLIPKSKPEFSTGVFYRPPNQAEFMDLMVEKFSNLNLKDNEIYFLGDFNINLFQNDKYILSGKKSTTSQGSVHTMINRYKKFCQIHSLKQSIIYPTRVTCIHPFLLTIFSQILLTRSFNPI